MKIRTRPSRPPPPTPEAQAALDAFLDHAPKPTEKKNRGRKLTHVEVAIDDANHRAKSGVWEKAQGRAFVGLYALCFKLVYGETPIELNAKGEYAIACRMAARCLHAMFDDDPDALVEYIKWSWDREKRMFAWKLRDGVDRKPMGARLQFSASLIQTYRVDLRSGGKKRRG